MEDFYITTDHPLDPRNDPAGVSESTARAIACEEMLVTPAFIAADLMEECEMACEPINIRKLSNDMTALSIPELLALIMDGLDAQCLAARHELKQRLITANQWFINERSVELMEEV